MGGSSEQDIWNALTSAGLSDNQAAGVMGNMFYESSWNVESAAMDSNGAMAYGLISWNQASYPNANTLVTGNPAADLKNQVNYLLHNTQGTSQGLSGGSASAVGGNWAQHVEVCAGCQQGGSQYNLRSQKAAQVLQDAKTGNWQPGGAGAPGTAQLTSATTCLGPSLFGHCLGPSIPDLSTLAADAVKIAERVGLVILGAVLIIMGAMRLFGNHSATNVVKNGIRKPPE